MTFATAKFRSLLPAATFAMLAEFLMGISDMVVAGHILGESALSSLNLLQPVVNVVAFFGLMLGSGASVLFATSIGAFQERRAHELFTQGFFSVFLLGVPVMLVLGFGLRALLASFGADVPVTEAALSYGWWYLPCVVFEPLSVFLAAMCYSDGDGRICNFAYGAQLVANFILSIPLTYRFGIAGCAIASLAGHLLSSVILSGHLLRKGNNLRFVAHFSFGDTIRICRCAAGDASLKLCYAALFFLLNAFVVNRFGTEALPVLSVVIAVLGVAEIFDGVSMAVQPLASVYIGEGNDARTRSVMNTALLMALGEGLVVTLMLLVWPGLVLGLVGINDPELVPVAESAVRWVSLGLVATAVMMLFNSYYTFVEREGLATVLTVVTMMLAPVTLVPALGFLFEAKGVWLALGLAPTLSIVAIGAIMCGTWRFARFPYLLDPARRTKIRVFDLRLAPEEICSTSAAVGTWLKERGQSPGLATRAALLVEETLMVVSDRNGGRPLRAEVTVDLNDGLTLVLRDDGVIFDITDADAHISSLRSYLVSNLMTAIPNRHNLTTTGFNRNVFKL